MYSRPFPSLNKTIVNSSDYIAKKRQVSTYKNANRETSGFGVGKIDDLTSVVVTAPNYEELLTLTKGRHHCIVDNSGAETLKYDIWSGNKMVVDYGTHNPVTYTGDLDAAGGATNTRGGKSNMIPYPTTINTTSGYPGFIVDNSGALFGTGELGEGPAWVDKIADVSYTNTSDYKRGNKSQPLHNFHFPRRVPLD
tara:strand:- start:1858 stop:2442 length:585 start_codon:yes stop_codon:yes gene_type:complete